MRLWRPLQRAPSAIDLGLEGAFMVIACGGVVPCCFLGLAD